MTSSGNLGTSERRNAGIILSMFGLVHFGLDLIYAQLGGAHESFATPLVRNALHRIPQLVVALTASWAVFGKDRVLSGLGLCSRPFVGLRTGLLCSLPFVVLFAAHGIWAPGPKALENALHDALLPGFFEELMYRGMLFGFLFRAAKWGFVPSAVFAALFFGLAHAYQGSSWLETCGVVALTTAGAVWFAWLYAEWNWNLWLPISLHVLLNLYWQLFDVGRTALGSGLGNLGRCMVIVLSVLLTLREIRRRGQSVIDGRWWWALGNKPHRSHHERG